MKTKEIYFFFWNGLAYFDGLNRNTKQCLVLNASMYLGNNNYWGKG